VFDGFVLMAKNAPCTSMPIPLNKIVFGEDDTSTKIPSEYFLFLMVSSSSKFSYYYPLVHQNGV
jgi:hypothetical protein